MTRRGLFARAALLSVLFGLAACTAGTDALVRTPAKQPVSAEMPNSPAAERAKAHTELGALYMQESRFAVALEEAKIALSADRNYAPAYNLLALTHMFLGENQLAAENFERALNLAPGDPEFSNNYGWFLCQSGKESASFDHFLRAARNPLYPSPTKPYTNLGICQAKVKSYVAAEASLMTAYQLAPNNTLAMYWLAEVAYRQSQMAVARQWLSELERKAELTAEGTWLALRVERKMGNRDGELRYASQLRKRFTGSPELQKFLRGEFE